MNFVVADTFVKSLGQLDPQWQPAVKQAAFDFQMNPATPGYKLPRLERAKDPKMWSCRVNRDIRIILHMDRGNLTLCYVDHHDAAYNWGRNRRIEVHPATAALWIVEVVERTEEVIQQIVKQVEEEPPIFARYDVDPICLVLATDTARAGLHQAKCQGDKSNDEKSSQGTVTAIPFPASLEPDAQEHLVSHLDHLRGSIESLAAAQRRTSQELDALMPSILDKAFNGEL